MIRCPDTRRSTTRWTREPRIRPDPPRSGPDPVDLAGESRRQPRPPIVPDRICACSLKQRGQLQHLSNRACTSMFVRPSRAAAAPHQTSMYEHVRSTPAGPGRSLERQLTVVVAPSLIHGCWHQTTAGGLQNPDQDRHYRMFSMARRPFNAINPTLERQLTVVVAPAGGSINCSCASWTKNPLDNTGSTPPANASGPRHIGSFRPVSTQIDRNPRPATPVPTCGGLGHVFDK